MRKHICDWMRHNHYDFQQRNSMNIYFPIRLSVIGLRTQIVMIVQFPTSTAYHNEKILIDKYSKTCLQWTLQWEDTLWSGETSSESCPIFPILKQPAMKGHLSCGDTFSWIFIYPLKTGFTVVVVGGLGGGGGENITSSYPWQLILALCGCWIAKGHVVLCDQETWSLTRSTKYKIKDDLYHYQDQIVWSTANTNEISLQ